MRLPRGVLRRPCRDVDEPFRRACCTYAPQARSVRLTPWKVPPAKPHHAATAVDREDDTAPGKPQPRHQKGLAFHRAIRRQPGSRTDDPLCSRNVRCSPREQTIGLLQRSAICDIPGLRVEFLVQCLAAMGWILNGGSGTAPGPFRDDTKKRIRPWP